MTHWRLIIKYKSLSFRRWLRANVFTLFIMGPIILAGFYFITEPYLIVLNKRLGQAAATWERGDLFPISFMLTILLIAFSLSSTLKEIYATHSADLYLDALPIHATTRFHVTLLFRLLKNLPLWVGLLVMFRGIAADRVVDLNWWTAAAVTLVAFLSLSILQLLAVLVLVHFRLFGVGRLMILAAGLLVLAVLTKWHQLFLLPLLPLVSPALIFNQTLAAILSLTDPSSSILRHPLAHLILVVALFALTLTVYQRWRDEDLEPAREAVIGRRRGGDFLAERLRRVLKRPVAAQVVRDWQLTRRGFSSGVYLAFGFALLFQAGVIFAVRRVELSSEVFAQTALICCALSVFSLSALAPLLAKYQLPYFWVEKSAGLLRADIWKAKFWYARLVATPAFFLSVVVIAPISPYSSWDQALFILKLFIVSLMVSSVVGVLTFEIAPRPALGLIFSGILALLAAGLFIFYWVFWPLWLYGYVMVMHSMGRRAEARIYFTEVET